MATERIYYNARNYTPSLTDVKIDVYNSSNTAEADKQVMTELGSTGIYYYDFTTTSTGKFYAVMDCKSEPQTKTYEFTVSRVTAAGSAAAYCTTLEVCQFLGIDRRIPEWSVASSPAKETVGVGDGSVATFYLDHKNIIASTYTLYYGSTEAGATALTETTHYTLDKNNGTITLTATGKTLVSTNNIYAVYHYIEEGSNLNDSIISDIIDNCSADIESKTNRIFTTATATDEYIDTVNDIDEYFTDNRPIVSLGSLYTTQTEEGSTESWDDVGGTAAYYDLDLKTGRIVILSDSYKPPTRRRGLKITYDYGSATVPTDIRKACLYLVVMDLAMATKGSDIIIGNKDAVASLEYYENVVEKILTRYRVIPMYNS